MTSHSSYKISGKRMYNSTPKCVVVDRRHQVWEYLVKQGASHARYVFVVTDSYRITHNHHCHHEVKVLSSTSSIEVVGAVLWVPESTFESQPSNRAYKQLA